MKKILFLATIAIAMMVTSCGTSKTTTIESNNSHQPSYIKQNGAEIKAKSYSDKGFETQGAYSMFTIEEVIGMTREKIISDPERYISLAGAAEGNDLTTARMIALNQVCISYATQAGSEIEGKIMNQFSNLTEAARSKVAGAYAQNVSKFLMPTLKENYMLVRTNPNTSKIEVEVSYMIDETKAKQVRKESMDEAVKQVAKEVALEQAFIDSVEELVNEKPSIESDITE